jgi:hypothetical protein
MAVEYTIPQLKQLIAKAEQLGFWDDVEHFGGILAQMTAEAGE